MPRIFFGAEMSTFSKSPISSKSRIFASLSHKFSTEDLILNANANRRCDRNDDFFSRDDDDELNPVNSPVVLVAHNNVSYGFRLSASPARQFLQSVRFCLLYVDGPISKISLDLEIFVIKGRKRQSIKLKQNCTLGSGRMYPARLPGSVKKLLAAGYLGLDKKSIHIIIAELSIPENVFQMSVYPEEALHVLVDSVGFDLFKQITTPAVTPPTSNRVELISNEEEEDDKTHLWAHKDVMSCVSNVFKDLLDINKPEETKMESLKKGVMEMNLSGDALKEMMNFIYLRQANKDFGRFALEILPVAHGFLIKGLVDECERSLIDQLDSMSLEGLRRCLEASHAFNLEHLTTACVEMVTMYLEHNNDIKHSLVVEPLLELEIQHGHRALKSAGELNLLHKLDKVDDQALFVPLLSLGRDHDLDVLINHCVQWFKTNFTRLNAGGFIDALMSDTSENGRSVIRFLFEKMA